MPSSHRYMTSRMGKWLETPITILDTDTPDHTQYYDLVTIATADAREYLRQGVMPFEWTDVTTAEIRFCALVQILDLTVFDPVAGLFLAGGFTIRAWDETNSEVVAVASSGQGYRTIVGDGYILFSLSLQPIYLAQAAADARWILQVSAQNADVDLWAYSVQITKWA